MSYPAFQPSRSHKNWTDDGSGNRTGLVATAFTDLVAAASVTLQAEVDDVLEISLSALAYFSSVNSAGGDDIMFTAANGSGTNLFLSRGFSITQHPNTNVLRSNDGLSFYRVASGDLSSGYVTVKLQYRVSAGTAVIKNDAEWRTRFMVKNIGPVDPN